MIRLCTLGTTHVKSDESDDNADSDGEQYHCEAQNAPVLKAEDEVTIRVHGISINGSMKLPPNYCNEMQHRSARSDVLELAVTVRVKVDVDDCQTLEPFRSMNRLTET
jgi:hypothetical protein